MSSKIKILQTICISTDMSWGTWYNLRGADNEVITPLPYTIHKGEADGDNALLWTETYTYDYMPGSVAFYVQYSDFIEQQPGDMVFRLVLNN